MILQTPAGIPLDIYYKTPPGINLEDQPLIEGEKLGLSPYTCGETFYYFGKHLALPGMALGIILLTLGFNEFDTILVGTISNILFFIAAAFLLSVLREFIRGFKYKIKKGALYLPGPYVFKRKAEDYAPRINKIKSVKVKIGFVGDIMKMNKFGLKFHPDIKHFFKDVDLIVGNLEGIILDQNPPILKQAHSEIILSRLERLLSGDAKWLLCLSNNHSEDFSNVQFNECLHLIQNCSKFDVFGRKDMPCVINVKKRIAISCSTQWSNQKTWDYTSNYDDNHDFLQDNSFNILYLHWGFENEKYVRTRYQKNTEALLTGESPDYKGFQRLYKNNLSLNTAQNWDFIFAHHPHVLQPIMKVQHKITINKRSIPYNKLTVFSAGNFTSGANVIRKKKHISGIIMKCEIGPLSGYPEKLAIGNMEWRRTINHKKRIGKELLKLVCIDNEKYRTFNKPLFIYGGLFLIVYILSFLINSYF